MIDKGRRDVVLIYSDIDLARAGRPSMGLGRPESLVPIRGLARPVGLMIDKGRRDKTLIGA